MSFLNPFMLLGIAAVAVPIIIHLLNRRKFQKVVWGAMRFLRVSVEQNQRRMRIEDLILLLLRCLLLVLLAIALARPAIMSNAEDLFGQSKVTAVIILDNSYSMGVSDGTQTRFDQARAAAEQAIDSMPAGSATAVFLASDIVRAVIPEPTFDLNLARKTIREAPLTDRATDLFPALDAAVKTLQDRLVVRKEIFLITDGQSAGWRQLPEIQRSLEKAKGEIAIHVILVSDAQEQNLGLSALRLASGLPAANQAVRFEIKVTNYSSSDEARDVRVGLSVDDEPPGDEFTINALPAGATKSVSLFGKFRTEGYHSVTARIGEDRLAADDRRSLAVRALREVRVLLVDGEPGAEPRDGETYFLQQALAPVAPEFIGDYFVKAATISGPEFSQARLDDFDAIILANVPDFTDATFQALQAYLRRGGGLIIFPGPRVNSVFYNEQLFRRAKILPAALGAPRGEASQDEIFVNFQEKNFDHPIVELWNDPGAGTLSSSRFFRRFELQPPPLEQPETPKEAAATEKVSDAGPPRVILSYTDGSPAAMERNWGLGRVILFSSTADTSWNDLAVRPSFVPLLHRTLGSIIQRQDEGLNVSVGEKFLRRVGMEFLNRDATYFKPRQTDAVRDLRRIDLLRGWPTLQYDQTDLAGLYDVSVGEPPLALKFAAQANPYESDLAAISAAQLLTLKEVAQVVNWGPNFALKNLLERQRTGMEFWLPLVLAAILVAAAETFLGQWFSRSK